MNNENQTPRKAELNDGNIVYVHLIYVDRMNGIPCAVIELHSGAVRIFPVTYIEKFLEPPEA